MRVLIAVEDELYAAAAVDFVGSHNWPSGTIFKVMHAVDPPYVGDRVTAVYGNDLQREILEDRVQYAQQLVGETQKQLQSKLGGGSPVETNVTVGLPNHTILKVAEEWSADMIVMGSHGRSGFSKLLLGSISMSVLSHAPCSVVIVKLPQEVREKRALQEAGKTAVGANKE